MSEILRVLLVEDSENDAMLILRELRRDGREVISRRVDTRKDMTAALEEAKWDIILSDFAMPKFSGLDALEVYKEKGLDIPIIVISGTIGEVTAVGMMKAGVHDYLMKDSLARLAPAVERELREAKIRRQRRQAEDALHSREILFRTIVEAAPSMLVINNKKFNINTYVSPNCIDFTGYSQKELTNNFVMWVHKDDNDTHLNAVARALQGIEIRNLEYKAVRKNGEIWFASVSIQPFRAPNGEIDGFVTQTIDITERKKADDELNKLNRALQVTIDCNQALVRTMDENTLLQEVCQIIVETGSYHFAWIAFYSIGSKKIQPIVSYGHEGCSLDTIRKSCSKERIFCAPVEAAIQSKSFVVVKDILKDPKCESCHAQAKKCQLASLITLPLIFENSIFGSLSIYADQPDAFDNDEIMLLQEMANDLAYGISTLRTRIEVDTAGEMLEQSNAELALAYDATLEGWSHALELRERETAGHSQRVVSLTLSLGKILGINDEYLIHVRRGALLHDIGKMGIPDSILLKPGTLSPEEWIVMRQHPIYAFQLLSGIPYLLPALDLPYGHHERWDGSGYPQGLKGDMIPLSARIFAIVDVWDALSSDRPYRPAWPKTEVRNYLVAQSGKQFDPNVVNAFLSIIDINKPF
jgi:PAS domain S-box-containing protein